VDDDQGMKSIIFAEESLKSLNSYVSSLSLSEGTIAYIYERSTTYLVASSIPVALTSFNASSSSYDRVPLAFANDSTIRSTASRRDGSFNGYLVEVEDVDDAGIEWSVVLANRESQIYRSSRKKSSVAFASAAIIIVFA